MSSAASPHSISAGAVGGARIGIPKQASIFLTASGGLTAQRMRILPPQRSHSIASAAKTRTGTMAYTLSAGFFNPGEAYRISVTPPERSAGGRSVPATGLDTCDILFNYVSPRASLDAVGVELQSV